MVFPWVFTKSCSRHLGHIEVVYVNTKLLQGCYQWFYYSNFRSIFHCYSVGNPNIYGVTDVSIFMYFSLSFFLSYESSIIMFPFVIFLCCVFHFWWTSGYCLVFPLPSSDGYCIYVFSLIYLWFIFFFFKIEPKLKNIIINEMY